MINDHNRKVLEHRLDNLLDKDKNAKNGKYLISSIYFDNVYLTSYNQVLDGISERWKYRIRFYNNDSSYIKLEKKYKINGKTNKSSTRITKDQLLNIINNKNIQINDNNNCLLNELFIKIKTEFLKPIILIEYDRIPYVYNTGNVRITLDYNIRYCNNFDSIFSDNKFMKSINDSVLEVKYDTILPQFIKYQLQLNYHEQTSFSKYRVCIDGMGVI